MPNPHFRPGGSREQRSRHAPDHASEMGRSKWHTQAMQELLLKRKLVKGIDSLWSYFLSVTLSNLVPWSESAQPATPAMESESSFGGCLPVLPMNPSTTSADAWWMTKCLTTSALLVAGRGLSAQSWSLKVSCNRENRYVHTGWDFYSAATFTGPAVSASLRME